MFAGRSPFILFLPVEKYHPPSVFDYFAERGAYIGSIIFWREKEQKPISSGTLKTLRTLRPFLCFMLTDCIARRRQANPGTAVFTDTVDMIVQKENLTVRQRDVLMHQLLGKTYAQTGASLSIATNTVRSHVKAIHARTGTSTVVELFARHFSPLQETKKDKEE